MNKMIDIFGGLVEAVRTPVEPVAVVVTPAVIDRELLTEHAALSEKLGVYSGAVREIKTSEWETFLSESGLRVYDEAQVDAYLTSKYGAEQKGERGQEKLPTWGWRPLRNRDHGSQPMSDGNGIGWISFGSGLILTNGAIQPQANIYQKPIPIPVLLTIERVVEKFPIARLYVSDDFHPREFVKDPFLMVVHLGKRYIIERWDEPNYRER